MTNVHPIHAKVAAAGVAGAVTTVLVAIAAAAGVDLSSEVSAAITTLITFGAGYLKQG